VDGTGRTMMMKNPIDRIPIVLKMLYPDAYLDAKIPGDRDGKTYRDLQIEVSVVCSPIF
jgi:hypothetical protein